MKTDRYHYIDLLRIIAILIMFVYHVFMVFAADWDWHIKNMETSNTLLEINYWMASFRMPLLFFVSGYISYILMQRLGLKAFVMQRQYRIHITGLVLLFAVITLQAQQTVPAEKMQKIYEEIKTPHKYGLVVTADNNTKKIDCPSVFRKGKHWYMTWIQFDGRGYETWLSKSKDLLNWTTLGKIMSFSDTADWDNNQKAGYTALANTKWEGSYKLKKYKGRYWLSYIGGKERGYESGQLAIGLASTKRNPAKPHEWDRLPNPVLSATDSAVRWWENKKLYKSSIIWDKSKTTGYPFVMYYNANGDTSNNTPKWRWFERIGMAVSNDMIHWERYKTDPVVHHKIGITGDGVIQKIGDLWVMFYFGAFWEGRKDAFNRFACSYDLVNWTDWTGEDLVHPSEDYDAKYAHKSYVVKWKGVVYHFYCAVDQKDNRGIALITSLNMGSSQLVFK